MNTPQAENRNQVPLIIAGGALLTLLITSIIATILFEQKHRAISKATLHASPQPISLMIPASSSPSASYQPNIPGISKQEAFDLFQTVTFDKDIYHTDKHLVRWESKTIPWRLRGQFTAEDTQCMQSIEKQFNTAMDTSKLEEQSNVSQKNGITIYILPSDQFSSVDPDIRPEQPAQILYTLSGYTFSSVELLVDIHQSMDFRCYYLRNLMLRAVGLESPKLANYLVGESTSPSFLQYGRLENFSHSEMLRILYSPLLTAGLTQEETKRRILQP